MKVVARTQSDLMAQMSKRNWPVTVSIGSVTFSVPPPSPDEAIRLADELMYSVKRADKNGIKSPHLRGLDRDRAKAVHYNAAHHARHFRSRPLV